MNIGDVRREIPWNKDSHEERVPRDVSKIDAAIFISKVQKQRRGGGISLERSLSSSNTTEKFAKRVLSLNYRAEFKIFWNLTWQNKFSFPHWWLSLSVCQLRVQSHIHNKVWSSPRMSVSYSLILGWQVLHLNQCAALSYSLKAG